jgi:hypothetical protein
MCFPGIRMLARRCGVSKISNVKLRDFLRYSAWVPVLRLRSEELVARPQAGADNQLGEEVR